MFHPHKDTAQYVRGQIRQHMQSLGVRPEDTAGIELAALVRMVAGLYEAIGAQRFGSGELSAARSRLMICLLADDVHGGGVGLTPTYLSRFAHVSRNTISALLRGLEEQGLILRALDARDHRLFRIRLSTAGRELVQSDAPKRIAQFNELVLDLEPQERVQLAALLEKLYRSLQTRSQVHDPIPADQDVGR